MSNTINLANGNTITISEALLSASPSLRQFIRWGTAPAETSQMAAKIWYEDATGECPLPSCQHEGSIELSDGVRVCPHCEAVLAPPPAPATRQPDTADSRIMAFLLSHDIDRSDVITVRDGVITVEGDDGTHTIRTMADARRFLGY